MIPVSFGPRLFRHLASAADALCTTDAKPLACLCFHFGAIDENAQFVMNPFRMPINGFCCFDGNFFIGGYIVQGQYESA